MTQTQPIHHKKWIWISALLSVLALVPSTAMADDDEKVFEARFAPCMAALCGVNSLATLTEGEVEVDNQGNVSIEVEDTGLNNATLFVKFQPFNGAVSTVGSFVTDGSGDFDNAVVGVLGVTSTFGLFMITAEDGTPLYVTAFTTPAVGAPGSCLDDSDCDGILDDDDVDDDNDGIHDSSDDNPTSHNVFDDTSSKNELAHHYNSKLRAEKARVKAQIKALERSLRETQNNLKADFRVRRIELNNP